jgi:hypothetical protein
MSRTFKIEEQHRTIPALNNSLTQNSTIRTHQLSSPYALCSMLYASFWQHHCTTAAQQHSINLQLN